MNLLRSELLICLVIARLSVYVNTCMFDAFSDVRLGTDSMIALHWIKKNVNQWKQFERDWNREIHTVRYLTRLVAVLPEKREPGGPGHKSSHISRANLSELWWHGRQWLSKRSEC
ncbi:hypothetical protein HPB48_014589 [Haemaphysalis longicornis]|uniref:Uncharacterized protein n=1 Tax=Haemaphysalis longicornis TaxID=44386 RepID=A0A9J6FNX2_HAELO|nr:hypothetical protein HPB48_014589 [Haemaphysalis longicornis]